MAFTLSGDAATNRTNLGLGTAATLNVGTSANNIVQLDGSGNLPAVDGSALTGISAGVVQTVYAQNTTPLQQGGTSYQTIVDASITPTSASNSIIIIATGNGSFSNFNSDGVQRNHYHCIDLNGTTLVECVHELYRNTNTQKLPTSIPFVYKHSPASTSLLTYSLRTKGTGGGWDSFWNQVTGGSTIILMEVSA